MTTQNLTIAKTVLEQLGGRRFCALTGARDFVVLHGTADGTRRPGLAFRLPSYFAQKGINAIRITLQPSDTYRVEFSRVRGVKMHPVSEHIGIYWDGLAALFTAETGLVTAL